MRACACVRSCALAPFHVSASAARRARRARVDSGKGKFNLAPDRCEPELISAASPTVGWLVGPGGHMAVIEKRSPLVLWNTERDSVAKQGDGTMNTRHIPPRPLLDLEVVTIKTEGCVFIVGL